MFLVEMNRFWSTLDVVAAWHVPDAFADCVKAALEDIVVYTNPETGDKYVLERDVDALVERIVRQNQPDQPDGLYPPSRLRVDGIDYDCEAGKMWRLIECLWNKSLVGESDVIEAVYGTDADPASEKLRSLYKHLNAWFRREECPLWVEVRKSHYRLVFDGADRKN